MDMQYGFEGKYLVKCDCESYKLSRLPNGRLQLSHITGYFQGHLGTLPAVFVATKTGFFSRQVEIVANKNRQFKPAP